MRARGHSCNSGLYLADYSENVFLFFYACALISVNVSILARGVELAQWRGKEQRETARRYGPCQPVQPTEIIGAEASGWSLNAERIGAKLWASLVLYTELLHNHNIGYTTLHQGTQFPQRRCHFYVFYVKRLLFFFCFRVRKVWKTFTQILQWIVLFYNRLLVWTFEQHILAVYVPAFENERLHISNHACCMLFSLHHQNIFSLYPSF